MNEDRSKDAPAIQIRRATTADLPAIHGLIRESFAAMSDHTGPGFEDVFAEGAAEAARDGDLSAASFEQEYLTKPETAFWVAEHVDRGVLGCAGLKRLNAEDAELVRMSVTSTFRGGRIGARLVEALLAFAKKSGAKRVELMTANPSAARFYQRMGFAKVSEHPHTLTLKGIDVTLTLVKLRVDCP